MLCGVVVRFVTIAFTALMTFSLVGHSGGVVLLDDVI